MLALTGYMAHLCISRVCCSQPVFSRQKTQHYCSACMCCAQLPCSNVNGSGLSLRSSVVSICWAHSKASYVFFFLDLISPACSDAVIDTRASTEQADEALACTYYTRNISRQSASSKRERHREIWNMSQEN